MGANFTPDMQGYTSMKPFRFWCQKVLPTIYDDSLSYYEVLCKLVKILNTVIENMEKVEANTDALLNAFNLLQGWVNDYFDNLDVQDEIDDKLDRMVEDGTFDRYIQPILDEFEQTVQTISGHAVDEAREQINTIVGQGESAIRDVVRLYEVQAKQYVEDAEAWARGTVDGVPVPSTAEQYEDSSKYWAEQAQQAAGGASGSDEDAEAWAVGTKGGVPVPSTAPQYHDNSKYWSEESEDNAEDAEAWAKGTKDGTPVASDEPQYHDNAKYWAEQAQQSAGGAGGYDEDAEAWAVGTKDGVPVASDEPQYENNSKYWAEQAEQAAQDVDVNALKTFSCENSFNVFVQNCVTKSKSSITNASSVGYDHAGMLEFTIPVPTAYVANRPEYGDMLRDKNETTGEYHPLMISVSPIERTDAERYELIVDRTGGQSGLIDGNGNQHFFVLVMDRSTGQWAADGIMIHFNVYFTLIQTKYMGTAHNGTYQ